MIKLVAFHGYHRVPQGGQPVQQVPILGDLTVTTDAIGVTIATKTKSYLYPWATISRVENELVPSVASTKGTK